MMMGGLNIASSDPTVGKLLELLTSPKARDQAKELLTQLQGKLEELRKVEVTTRAQVADLRNTERIVEEKRIAAERLFEEANAKHEEATRRLAAAEAKDRAVADAIAAIKERVEI
jgi:hypothetical protein